MTVGVAIVREVSASLADCELTHLSRVAIDVELARAEHAAYQRALADAGYRVECVPAGPDMPDSVFIEDTAVVFDELAVATRPGAASRRIEVAAVADALSRYRDVRFIDAPGTMDGGDILAAGKRVFVGLSTRTNRDAATQLRRLLTPYGYTVCELEVEGCLHLKSAVTAVDERRLLVNPQWIRREAFEGFDLIAVDAAEPSAANALRLHDRVIFPSAFPRTADRIRRHGLPVQLVDAGEIAKAEGAVTCCSLIVNSHG